MPSKSNKEGVARVRKKLGRPLSYDPVIGEYICQELSKGRSLSSICSEEDIPGVNAVARWLWQTSDPDPDLSAFREDYDRARQAQAALFADAVVDISDDARNDWMETNDPDNPGYKFNGEAVARSKLRADNRKWVASRILSHIYGDKATVRHEGQVDTGPNLDYSLLTAPELKELRRLIVKATPNK